MCSSPEGYGSISRTYVDRPSAIESGSGFGTVKASSAAQAACHFASIASGSYRSVSFCSIALESLLWNEKASRMRGSGGVGAASPRYLPGLHEKLLHESHANRHDRAVLALFPESAAVEGAELLLGGVSAAQLAEEHGTPLLVLCEATIRGQARALRAATGDGRVFFGTKALPNVALLRLLREEGIGADVASAGELAFAREAGLGGGDLVVRRNNKGAALLREAAAVGAPVVLDAPDESALAAGAGVRQALVRVTLGVDADTHEAIRTGHHGSKFGLPPDLARAVVSDALDRGLDLLGVHVHVGSQPADFDAQAETIVRLPAFAARCRDELGWVARVADLGGGFGIRHHPDDDVPDAAELARGAASTARLAFAEAGLPQPELWLEQERCIVGRAGGTSFRDWKGTR